MNAEDVAREEPARLSKDVVNLRAALRGECRHVDSALAEPDDDDAAAPKDVELADVALGEDISLEELETREQGSWLVGGIMAHGDDDVIEALSALAVGGLDGEVPAVGLLGEGDDLVIQADIEGEMVDCGLEIAADLLACGVELGLERPGKVGEVVVRGDVLEADFRVGEGPDAADGRGALEEDDLVTEAREDPRRRDAQLYRNR
ncbi:MAG: hypothetical protein R3B70_35105 [Polyangiaceae bacterium]